MIANPMTMKEPFDTFYTRKLDALKIELKAIIKGDTPYVTSEEYACKVCFSRLKLHAQGHIYCLCCDIAVIFTGPLLAIVVEIMSRYPDVDESVEEWRAMQGKELAAKEKRTRTPKSGDLELGKQIKEARIKLGWSKRELGAKIFKPDGRNRLSGKSIEGYENGYVRPPEKVLEQIKQVLKMEGWQDWNDIERDLKGQSDG